MTKDLTLFILRLAGIGLAVGHGWPKIARLIAGDGERFILAVEALGFPMPVVFAWAAALAELVGGLAIALGLFTRLASAFAAFTMFVAAFVRHRFHQQVINWIGLQNLDQEIVGSWGNPELALIYFLVFCALILLGGGRYSLQRLIWRTR